MIVHCHQTGVSNGVLLVGWKVNHGLLVRALGMLLVRMPTRRKVVVWKVKVGGESC